MTFSVVGIIETNGFNVKTSVTLLRIFSLFISSITFFSPVVADIPSNELK